MQREKEKSMEDKIKEVQEYFVTKMINGDFEFVSYDEYCVSIIIDGKYSFELWIANKVSYLHLSNADSMKPNFMQLELKENQSNFIWEHLMPHIDQYNRTVVRTKKLKQIEELKKEVDEYEHTKETLTLNT